ncbi:AbrB/MazE/SpoVT family DNA-binding domain-containing protein [Pyrococcus kukulkanii]|uniref:AbrB/MazE/SpoVT family DNA-binding domain-containing protein n=1 Tax=Pyrococcus kukulkanii TaxID=1609559 RepID=UPI0035689FA1
MVTVKVSSKGQIVIPKVIREKFGIREGDELEILDFGLWKRDSDSSNKKGH